MRHLLAIALLLAAACHAAARQAPDIVTRADSLYNAGAYADAAGAYARAIDSLGRSSDLYYNLGGALYRSGNTGRAIVAYNRALRLNPRNSEARQNLDFLNSRITDRPGERGTLLEQALDRTCAAATPNGWAWVALGCFALTLGAVALYWFSTAVALRKTGFFGAGILLIVTAVAVTLALRSRSIATSHNMAVVIVPSSILSTSPREPHNRSEEAMLIHEGTLVQILDSMPSTAASDSLPGLWLDVRIDNTHRAWLRSTAVERL